jgi:hypothetical protein
VARLVADGPRHRRRRDRRRQRPAPCRWRPPLGLRLAAARAVALFWAGAERQRRCEKALREGDYAGLDPRMVAAFTISGIVLALTTAVLVLIEA